MTEIPDSAKLVILGAAAGVLSGLFGIGGGLVIVPALVLLFGLDIKTATGTSLFVILLPTGLLGVLEYHRNGNLKIAAGLWVVLGVFCGAHWSPARRGGFGRHDETDLRVYSLLLVATYFLFAPQGVAKNKPEPKSADSGLPAM